MDKTLYSQRQEILRQRLVALRQAAGMNQRQLAKSLNRERGLVSRLEVGQRRVDLAEFYAICEALGVDPAREASRLMQEFKKMEQKGGATRL